VYDHLAVSLPRVMLIEALSTSPVGFKQDKSKSAQIAMRNFGFMDFMNGSLN